MQASATNTQRVRSEGFNWTSSAWSAVSLDMDTRYELYFIRYEQYFIKQHITAKVRSQ